MQQPAGQQPGAAQQLTQQQQHAQAQQRLHQLSQQQAAHRPALPAQQPLHTLAQSVISHQQQQQLQQRAVQQQQQPANGVVLQQQAQQQLQQAPAAGAVALGAAVTGGTLTGVQQAQAQAQVQQMIAKMTPEQVEQVRAAARQHQQRLQQQQQQQQQVLPAAASSSAGTTAGRQLPAPGSLAAQAPSAPGALPRPGTTFVTNASAAVPAAAPVPTFQHPQHAELIKTPQGQAMLSVWQNAINATAGKRPPPSPTPASQPRPALPASLPAVAFNNYLSAAQVQTATPGAGLAPALRPALAPLVPLVPQLHSAVRPLYAPQQPLQRAPTEDDRRLLPRRGIVKVAARIGGAQVQMSPAVEEALMKLTDEFIAGAVAFGCSLARRRKADTLVPEDIKPHLERTWHLHVPGYSDNDVKPYRRPAASEVHKARQVAVRRAAAAAARSGDAPAADAPAEAAEPVTALPAAGEAVAVTEPALPEQQNGALGS